MVDGEEKSSNETSSTTTVVNTPAVPAKQSNGKATAGFVLSLVSMFCCGLLAPVGLIFSILGLNQAKSSNGAGKGLAIAGIIISAIAIVIMILSFLLGFTTSFYEAFSNY